MGKREAKRQNSNRQIPIDFKCQFVNNGSNFLKEYESESQYAAQAGPESQQSFYLRLLTAEIKSVFL